MRMNKKIRAIAFGMILICVAGCGSRTTTIDVSSLSKDLQEQVTWKDQLSEISQEKGLTLYGIDSGDVKTASFVLGTNATAEEIAVIEASSSDAVDTIQSAVDARIEAQKASCESYLPNEMDKLNNATIVVESNYVILCVCDTPSEAKTVMDGYIK